MASKEFQLMAHLMRRAGFGAAREELDALVEQGYETTVESRGRGFMPPREAGTSMKIGADDCAGVLG